MIPMGVSGFFSVVLCFHSTARHRAKAEKPPCSMYSGRSSGPLCQMIRWRYAPAIEKRRDFRLFHIDFMARGIINRLFQKQGVQGAIPHA